MENITEQIRQLNINLLQLQRSALIDTQTSLQLLVDKGICDVEDIVETRKKIETESEDVKRIDNAIIEQGGAITATPIPENMTKKAELKKQLDQLYTLLQGMANN